MSGKLAGRLVMTAVALVILVPLGLMIRSNVEASNHMGYCSGTGVGRSSDVGAADPRAALRAFLATSASARLPRSGWTGPTHGGPYAQAAPKDALTGPTDLEFRSGDSRVSVGMYKDATGWFVTAQETCSQV